MDIRNSNFSADERLLLNFILSRPFPERAEAIRFLNSLTSGEIVRD